MPKRDRLTHSELTTLPRGRSQRRSGAFFLLITTQLPALSHSRATFVVPKRVSLSAVVRNRIKRRCRAALTPLLKGARSPMALIFTAKREAAAASFAELCDDIERLI